MPRGGVGGGCLAAWSSGAARAPGRSAALSQLLASPLSSARVRAQPASASPPPSLLLPLPLPPPPPPRPLHFYRLDSSIASHGACAGPPPLRARARPPALPRARARALPTLRVGNELLGELAPRRPRVSAVVCVPDMNAMQALFALPQRSRLPRLFRSYSHPGSFGPNRANTHVFRSKAGL